MKKINLCLCISLLLLTNTTIAQTQITMGSTQKTFGIYNNFLGKIGSKYYYRETSTTKTKLSVFNSALELEKQIILEKPEGENTFYHQKQFIIGDKIYLFGFENNAASKKGNYFLSILNEDFTTMREWKKFYSLPMGNTSWIFYLNTTKQFGLFNKGYLESDEKAMLNVIMFNDKFEVENESSAKLNYKWKDISIYSEFISESGNYFLIGKIKEDDLKIIYNIQDDELFENNRNLPKSTYLTLNILENVTEHKFYFTGFYSRTKDNFEGTYLYTIDTKTGEMSDIIKTAFTDEFKANFIRKENEKNKPTIPIHEVKNCFYNKDGNIILVAEQITRTREGVRGSTGSGMSTYQVVETIIHLDIIVICLKPDGDILWSQIIPKIQNSDAASSSFGFYQDDKSLHFIFYDSEKNYQSDKKSKKYVTDVYPLYKGKVVVMNISLLNENGKLNASEFVNAKDFSRLYISKMFQVNNELILYSFIGSTLFSWGDKYILGKYKF